MNTSPIYTDCPIVGDKTMRLYVRTRIGPTEQRYFPFDQRVMWLRESETQIFLTHRCHVFGEYSNYGDYRASFLSNIHHLGITESAKGRGIRAGDVLRYGVRINVTDSPVFPDASEEAKRLNADPTKLNLYQQLAWESPWVFLSDDGDVPPRLEPKTVCKVPCRNPLYSWLDHDVVDE